MGTNWYNVSRDVGRIGGERKVETRLETREVATLALRDY